MPCGDKDVGRFDDKTVGEEPSLVEFIRWSPDFDALELDRASDHGRTVEL